MLFRSYTDRGWVYYSDLKDTDKVASLNPDTNELEFTGFHNRFEHSADTFVVFECKDEANNVSACPVTLDHMMWVWLDDDLIRVRALTLHELLGASRSTRSIVELGTFAKDGSIKKLQLSRSDCVIAVVKDDNFESMEDSRSYKVSPVDIHDDKGINVWDITLDKNHVMLVKPYNSNVPLFSGNCGTGNLMRTCDYPQDKLFLSTLLPEDVAFVKHDYPDATCFQCDFLNGIDLCKGEEEFSDKLPSALRSVLEKDEPICFFMNPPYKVGEANRTEVGQLMVKRGMGKCGKDILHQFFYRILLIKRYYNLHHVYMCIFGNVTLFVSNMLKALQSEITSDFTYDSGMFFTSEDFNATSSSIKWTVLFTTWHTRLANEVENPVTAICKVFDSETNKVSDIGERVFRTGAARLQSWIEPKKVMRYKLLPAISSFNTFCNTPLKFAVGALGQVMSDSSVKRGARHCSISSLPCLDGIDIMPENFMKCVVSFGVRRVYARRMNAFDNSGFYLAPDMSIEGYDVFEAGCLVLSLFDYSSCPAAYRGIKTGDGLIDMPNFLFPLSKDFVRTIVSDSNIINDMNTHEANNELTLAYIEKYKPLFSKEAQALYDFGIAQLIRSLKGTVRHDINYANYSVAWDACLTQLNVDGFWDFDTKFSELTVALKESLYAGLYKYKIL